MGVYFNPGLHKFELQDSVNWNEFLLHSENYFNQACSFERSHSCRTLKSGRGFSRGGGIASVSVSFYGIEPSGPSLLSFREVLLTLPVTARRFIAGAVAGEAQNFV